MVVVQKPSLYLVNCSISLSHLLSLYNIQNIEVATLAGFEQRSRFVCGWLVCSSVCHMNVYLTTFWTPRIFSSLRNSGNLSHIAGGVLVGED